MPFRLQRRFQLNLLGFAVLAFCFIPIASAKAASDPAQRNVTKLAEGVYAIEHLAHSDDGMFSGNTTVIIGTRQVFVVDSAYLPSVTREDIAQIRQWTNKPVTFLLNTHFHNDHNLGNSLYVEAFPAVTIIAHSETKKSMDLFGPGSANREERAQTRIQKYLDDDKGPDGKPLSAEDRAFVKQALEDRRPLMEEIRSFRYQTPTLTFNHDFSIDLGDREVQVKFLGRANTAGDAIAYLPKEKIAVVGDLLGSPIPLANDGYPTEWIQTLQNLGQLDADTFVTGHGQVLHDKSRIFLYRDLLQSAVDQMNAKLRQLGPAMSHTIDEVKGSIDLSSFQQRFIGNDQNLVPQWQQFTGRLIKTIFEEASLR
jgi:glyoxylase-like metal-dependent hydrolase (beta-lactamase superfamily II)